MKYRKKPVVIEAIRFLGKLENLNPLMTLGKHYEVIAWDEFENPEELSIFTLEGNHLARIGDWIIKGVAGECYPCRHDIFQQTYEKVE